MINNAIKKFSLLVFVSAITIAFESNCAEIYKNSQSIATSVTGSIRNFARADYKSAAEDIDAALKTIPALRVQISSEARDALKGLESSLKDSAEELSKGNSSRAFSGAMFATSFVYSFLVRLQDTGDLKPEDEKMIELLMGRYLRLAAGQTSKDATSEEAIKFAERYAKLFPEKKS